MKLLDIKNINKKIYTLPVKSLGSFDKFNMQRFFSS